MDQRADVRHRDLEISGIDSENAVLAFIPAPLLVHQVPVPGAHLTGGKREAATLLGLLELHVRSFKRSSPFGHMLLKLQIHSFELAGLAEQLSKYPHLCAQDLGNHWHRNVINGSHLVAAQPIDIGQVNGGYEDDRGFAEARMFANHRSQLEPVQFRHADVDQDDRNVILEQKLQRFACRRGLDQVLAKLSEDHLVGEKLVGLIVDQKDVDFVAHGGALAMQPHT
jgi:hypothetical protein